MRKIAIIGASYLQNPLILKAKEMGLETHVFAWQCGDVGETTADYFYPISIVEKDAILEQCRMIGIDGICTIASDLAAVTVNYVAYALGLACNNPTAALISTNKHEMRKAFAKGKDPSPKSLYVEDVADLKAKLAQMGESELQYPVIVKPIDRSGSRGITKLSSSEGLADAIAHAKEVGFDKHALVEEFAEGAEYSIECISYHGTHTFLQMTKKYTTGAPHFIETGHMEPAPVSAEMLERVKAVVFHALDSLQITDSASHSELKIAADGTIRLIEIGGRMGGDFIGSNLVELSTGVDFIRNVIEVALGEEPSTGAGMKGDVATEDQADAKSGSASLPKHSYAAVRFIFNKEDEAVCKKVIKEHPEWVVASEFHEITGEVTDSSNRYGYVLMAGEDWDAMEAYMPSEV